MEQTTQKIVEEATKVADNGMVIALASGMIAAVGGVFTFVFSRLDKKVDKDVFKQFEKKNDQAHQFTHTMLTEMKADIKDKEQFGCIRSYQELSLYDILLDKIPRLAYIEFVITPKQFAGWEKSDLIPTLEPGTLLWAVDVPGFLFANLRGEELWKYLNQWI